MMRVLDILIAIFLLLVDNIGINFNNDFITDIGGYTPCYMVYGVNIFASREEAEKRLKELQE